MYPVDGEHELKSIAAGHMYGADPIFNIGGVEYKLLFDFHLFDAFDKTTAKEREVVYRLKRELLMDIIAQLSSHVNRLGISYIK